MTWRQPPEIERRRRRPPTAWRLSRPTELWTAQPAVSTRTCRFITIKSMDALLVLEWLNDRCFTNNLEMKVLRVDRYIAVIDERRMVSSQTNAQVSKLNNTNCLAQHWTTYTTFYKLTYWIELKLLTICVTTNRTHNKSLTNKTSHSNDKDFITRMLYKRIGLDWAGFNVSTNTV